MVVLFGSEEPQSWATHQAGPLGMFHAYGDFPSRTSPFGLSVGSPITVSGEKLLHTIHPV